MISDLIKDVLVPEKIGTYYITSEKVLGIDIGKSSVNACLIQRSGKFIYIEKTFQETIEADVTLPFEERVQRAIKKIVSITGSKLSVRTSLPSSQAVFKELLLPFADPEKIAMIIRYEIEPYLPFPLQEAIVDGIITGKQDTQSRVLVAAVKQEYIIQHLQYFENTGLVPETITIDLFDIYSLYRTVPAYGRLEGAVVVLDIGFNSTKVAYILDSQLLLVRTLQKGILTWARSLAQQLEIPPQEALNQLLRFGFDGSADQNYHDKITVIIKPFIEDLNFTFNSFIAQLKTDNPIKEIILLGEGAELPGIAQAFTQALAIPTMLFDISGLLQSGNLKIVNSTQLNRSHLSSLATALETPVNEQFNLRRDQFKVSHTGLFIKQLGTALTLTLLIFGMLLTHVFLERRKLQKEVTKLEKEIITVLKSQGLTKGRNLQTSLSESQEKVSQEEGIWFAFSSQTRFSFLKHLQVLSTVIDKEGIGLKINKFIISEKEPSSITIDGQVRDFDALKILEKELKESQLFMSIPSLQNTKFNITMPLVKNGDEQ